MTRFLLALALFASGLTARAVDPLKYVPPDAALFAHLDVKKLMSGPLGQAVRKAEIPIDRDSFETSPGDKKTEVIYAAGREKLLKATGIDLDGVRTVTLHIPKLKGPGDEATVVFTIVLEAAYEQAKFLKGLAEIDDNFTEPKVVGPGLVEFGARGMRFGFPDDRTIQILGTQVKELPKAVDQSKGVIKPAIDAAAKGSLGVFSLNFDQFPEEIKGDELPAEIRPFAPLIKSDVSYATFEQNDKILDAVIRIRSSDKAKTLAAEKALENLITFGKTGLAVAETQLSRSKEPGMDSIVKVVRSLQETLKTARYESDDTEAKLLLSMKADETFATSILSALSRIQGASTRSVTQNSMKQIGLAMHNYESAHGTFPAAAICDKNGKPLLSWRVAILPYIEQDNLYKQFKLDEPWDSAHNIKLAEYVVRVYTIPGQSDLKKTHFRVFTGEQAYSMNKPGSLAKILDGTSNTLMAVMAKEPVIWTKPDELTFDPKKNPAEQLLFKNDVTNVLFMDGSVRAMPKSLKPEVWKGVITWKGGEVVNFP